MTFPERNDSCIHHVCFNNSVEFAVFHHFEAPEAFPALTLRRLIYFREVKMMCFFRFFLGLCLFLAIFASKMMAEIALTGFGFVVESSISLQFRCSCFEFHYPLLFHLFSRSAARTRIHSSLITDITETCSKALLWCRQGHQISHFQVKFSLKSYQLQYIIIVNPVRP